MKRRDGVVNDNQAVQLHASVLDEEDFIKSEPNDLWTLEPLRYENEFL